MRVRTSAGLLTGMLIATLLAPETGRAAGAALHPSPRHLIVRFASEGERALEECAETLFRERRSYAGGTADGSDSLDAVHARVRPRDVRAIFRRPDARPLREQRARMSERIRRRLPAERRANRAAPPLPELGHVYRVEIGEGISLEEARTLYEADPHVVWVQRDHTHALNGLPNDPFLHSSGSWGQPYADLWGLHRIRAPQAWATSQGEGVVVAVVDTGLDYHHPDIAANVWLNAGEDVNGNGRVDAEDWNGLDDDGNGFIDDLRGYDFAHSADTDDDGRWDGPRDHVDPDPFDDNGHGTHVAGTIAALAGNGIGIAGVAPRATIMPLKGFPAAGPGLDSVLWRAVLYAAENGARVVNNSWSCRPDCPDNPLADEVMQIVHAMGVVVVTSAGNRLRDVVRNNPENTHRVVTVASSSEEDEPSLSFSNHGWLLDVAAPGGGPGVLPGVRVARRNILSLRSGGGPEDEPFAVAEEYLRFSGTSMAAPHVAGVAALLLAQQPGLVPDEVRRILRQSALDLGPPGHDRRMGAGRVDALAALEWGPLPDLHAAITSPQPGGTWAPREERIEIRGVASGADLEQWTLRYGLGNEPDVWHTITSATRSEVEGDVLGRWDISEREPGTYVVRLDVHGQAGDHYVEFLPLSLESGRFVPVSSPGPDARSPDVAGPVVVWQSRRDPRRESGYAVDLNLFTSDLATGAERAVQLAPGDQRDASVARGPGLISWLDERHEAGSPQVFACSYRRRTGACDEVSVSPGAVVSMPPVSSAGRVAWLTEESGTADLRACRLGRRDPHCRPQALGVEPGPKLLLGSDGAGLVWTDFTSSQRFGVCRLDARLGSCPAVETASPIFARSRGAASGGLLAWVGFDLMDRKPLQICELDAMTGACEPVLIAEGVSDLSPDLSGNRLVWDGHVGDEAGDVFFCEYDAVRDRCPVQRLTAQMGVQEKSAIDGRRVVWEDDREGPVRIYAAVLPGFTPIADRRVHERERLNLIVRVTGTGTKPGEVWLAAEAVGADDLDALGAEFVDLGNGRGVLRWRPAPGQAGSYAITFSATTPERLVTRQSVRIEVMKRARARPRRSWRHWWARLLARYAAG